MSALAQKRTLKRLHPMSCGLTQDGLPVGLQLVGRPHGDAELLGTALFLEQALGFDRCVPLEI
jgi:amidase